MIEKERSGETIDRSLVKSLLRMLSSLQVYHKVFENNTVETQYSNVLIVKLFNTQTQEFDLIPENILTVESPHMWPLPTALCQLCCWGLQNNIRVFCL
ncbi:Cullin-4A [Portunus trituberculatus]|uniref:Cullin-4A n=1 Tax=Portunus trituberculatus TaxID=210409 RepID=A0A5B7D076_PORTR|nr:Cullin-4A [Portunus trituberculatus]